MRLRLLKILSICILPILFFSCTADVSGSGDGEVTITAYDADSWTENGGDSYDDGMGRIVFMAPENPPDMDLTFEVSVFVESIEYSEIVGPGKIVEIANVPVGMIKVLCRALNDDGSIVAMGSAKVRIVPYKTTSIDLILKKMEEPVTTYDILIDSYTHGSVTSSRERASFGDEVTLTINPEDGYELDELSVIGSGGDITINQAEDGKHYWFIMPEDNLYVTATFKRKQYQFHSTVTSAGSTGSAGTGTYVYFGDWPQTRKSADVTITSEIKTVGSFTYSIGDDGNYYAGLGDNYYKVEPIKWRVLNPSSSGEKKLLAENILVGDIPFFDSIDDRNIGGNTIYACNYEYSQVRAYLNGLSYYNIINASVNDYNGKGFLQSAFTESARSLILQETVDNSLSSIYPANSTSTPDSNYLCPDTTDKVFLLSVKEVTSSDYGFAADNVADSSRLRKPTDFAIAQGAYTNGGAGYGWWWLRSPANTENSLGDSVRTISTNGKESGSTPDVNESGGGICPAIRVNY